MRQRKKKFLFLILGLLFLAAFMIFVVLFPPSANIPVFKAFPLEKKVQELFSTNIIFFILLFLATMFLFGFLLNNLRRGLLLGVFAVSYLLLRFFQFTPAFYTILVVVVLLGIEVLFVYKK